MRHFLALAVCLLSINAVAQKRIPFESKCEMEMFCVDCGSPRTSFEGNLTKYFKKAANIRKLSMIRGLICVNIIIDTNGKACCKGITHQTMNSNEEIIELRLGDLIDNMPLWRPAVDKGKHVNSSVVLMVYSNVEGYGNLKVELPRISFVDDPAKENPHGLKAIFK